MRIWKVLFIITLSLSFKVHAQVASSMTVETMEKNLAKITESIRISKSRIKNIRDARFLPELYFALAEFYTDKARYMYAIKVAKNNSKSLDELDFSIEKRPKLEAIEVYNTIIDKFAINK